MPSRKKSLPALKPAPKLPTDRVLIIGLYADPTTWHTYWETRQPNRDTRLKVVTARILVDPALLEQMSFGLGHTAEPIRLRTVVLRADLGLSVLTMTDVGAVMLPDGLVGAVPFVVK